MRVLTLLTRCGILAAMLFLTSCTKETIALRIINVTIHEFPALNGTSSWDFTGGPDIYLAVMQNNTVRYQSFGNVQDAEATRPHNFNEIGLRLDDLEQEYELWLYDADFPDEDDFIGGASFLPSDFMRTDEIELTDGRVKMTLEVEWIRE